MLRVGSQHRAPLPDDLFDDRAADANLADVALVLAQLGHAHLQLANLFVAQHDQATVGRHGLEDERRHLPERLVERRGRKQRDRDFADEREQIAVLIN